MIKLTFDTNILRDYLCPSREHHSHAAALVRLDEEGICEIRVVSRFTEDVPEGDLRGRLDELKICQRPRIGTIAEWDVSDWDADFWATDEEAEIHAKLFELIFPAANHNSRKQKSRAADVGHLLGHMQAKRDVFVTRDRPILAKASTLFSQFGICVMSPADAVRHCRPK
jgi:hypothetical protein